MKFGFYRLVMHKSYQNFWLAKAPEIKYIPLGVYCHAIRGLPLYGTVHQSNSITLALTVWLIVFRNIQLILIKMRKCHSILCFLFSPPAYACVQYNYQGTQEGDQETDLIYRA